MLFFRKKRRKKEKRKKEGEGRQSASCFTSRAHACGADESANVADIWRAIRLPNVAPDGAPEYAGTRLLKAQTFHKSRNGATRCLFVVFWNSGVINGVIKTIPVRCRKVYQNCTPSMSSMVSSASRALSDVLLGQQQGGFYPPPPQEGHQGSATATTTGADGGTPSPGCHVREMHVGPYGQGSPSGHGQPPGSTCRAFRSRSIPSRLGSQYLRPSVSLDFRIASPKSHRPVSRKKSKLPNAVLTRH